MFSVIEVCRTQLCKEEYGKYQVDCRKHHLIDLPWVNAITTFFGWLGWALFVVGLVVGAFECAIEYQGGRGSIKDTALNYVKGFMAVSLFSFLPKGLSSHK